MGDAVTVIVTSWLACPVGSCPVFACEDLGSDVRAEQAHPGHNHVEITGDRNLLAICQRVYLKTQDFGKSHTIFFQKVVLFFFKKNNIIFFHVANRPGISEPIDG